MIRICSIVSAGVLAACVFVSGGLLANADDTSPKTKAKPADTEKSTKAAASPAKAKRELSPALIALRDRVRETLATYQKQAYNTRENSATEIMSHCLAFGCGSEVSLEGQPTNGITCLCWNYPCNGFEMLGLSQGHIAAHVGYGYQERPGEFLAMLALARVQDDYPIRVGQDIRTVTDLVTAEKLACRSGSDLSVKLIGLSYYIDEPEWKNDLGETWSVDRIIKEEIAQPVVSAPEGGLNRLMGLSCAAARRAKLGRPIDGQFLRAQKYVADFHDFAMQLQNSDGSWGPSFLAARSNSNDAASQMRSTGRVLEWLAVSLPERRLEDARVTSAVEYMISLLGNQRYQWNTPALSTREIVSVGHAIHGLMVYDERVFKPAEKPAADKTPVATSREDTSAKSR